MIGAIAISVAFLGSLSAVYGYEGGQVLRASDWICELPGRASSSCREDLRPALPTLNARKYSPQFVWESPTIGDEFAQIEIRNVAHLRPVKPVKKSQCVVNHGCKWEQPPSIEYPSFAGAGDAICSTTFTIDDDGFAIDIVVDCDDARFNEATLVGLATFKHTVTDPCGNICPLIGQRIEYPIDYRLED